MKPSKKKQNSDKTRKTANEASNTKIKDYFKSSTKSSTIPETTQKVDSGDGTKDFYVKLLKEKLQKLNDGAGMAEASCDIPGTDGAVAEGENNDGDFVEHSASPDSTGGAKLECVSCVQKNAEYKELEEKYNELKKRFVKLTIHHSEVDLKYHDLLKATTANVRIVDGDSETNGDLFTVNELKFLDCMQLDKKKDSTFVNQCLQFAYKADLSALTSKSLKGTKDWVEFTEANGQVHHSAKNPLTPAKVDRIRDLYIARIAKCKIDAVAYGERIGNLNKHFASGIKNINF